MNTTLILGGNGKTGRRVAQRLSARGVPLRIGSRSGTPPFDNFSEAVFEPPPSGEIAFPLTGPRLLTFAEAPAEIARASGREVRYIADGVERALGRRARDFRDYARDAAAAGAWAR
jgi:uncharacterized protein YbjT (DUF2867 family)